MAKLVASRVLRVVATALMAIALLLPLVPTAATAAPRPERMHPALGRMADQNPGGKVRVIVQGRNPNGELSRVLDDHGAKEKKALPFVKAIAAEMPLGRVRALAKHPNVNWVTIDAQMVPTVAIDTTKLLSVYPLAVNAQQVWNGATPYRGAGVTVAVIDSGMATNPADYSGRMLRQEKFSTTTNSMVDEYGHGTHVAGIIGGNGAGSAGKYVGIAPEANLVNLKVSNDVGMSYISNVIDALAWVHTNRATYNIRVVNLSLASGVPESYLTSPLSAAVERVWLAGVVVVASSGNAGPNTALYPPGNDPFVITVGASDSNGTATITDDLIPSWSSYGTTQNGHVKPEVLAPGRQIVSLLTKSNATLGQMFPDRILEGGKYIRMSGTSMATPVVSGIVALALQAHPTWTPDQVKYVITNTARPLNVTNSGPNRQVDAQAVVSATSPGYANVGLPLNQWVATVTGTGTYNSATWDSATWDSATWDSATWDSATWDSATWDSATWESTTWLFYPD